MTSEQELELLKLELDNLKVTNELLRRTISNIWEMEPDITIRKNKTETK